MSFVVNLTTIGSVPRGDFKAEGVSLVRAFAGAFLFAMPLLYTLEMWQLGTTLSNWKLYVLLIAALVLNVIVNYYSGFREGRSTWRSAMGQAIEVTAVGLVAGALMLLVIDRISIRDPLEATMGMIIIQAVPLSIGASVANSVFRATGADASPAEESEPEGSGFLNDVGATVVGSVLIGFGVAPTDEGRMLAGSLDYRHLAAIMVFSMLLSYGIVFASGFDRGQGPGPFQSPLTETALSYLISLTVSGLILYLLDFIHTGVPIHMALAMIIVLGLPATIGGAAGRLVI
ncbi:MAG: TIGR02587 family membrane protein [Thermomicrobiales bacterium]